MPYAVFKPQYTRLNERVAHHGEQSATYWYAIAFVPTRRLNSTDAESAMAEAKRLGYIYPVIGEVAP